MVKTYNPKEVLISFGTHAVTGLAEDGFIKIESNGDGITDIVGCDGEQVRSINPDNTWNITITLLQTSMTNAWLQKRYEFDIKTSSGMFPVSIKDLRGGTLFSCEQAWVTKPTSRDFGKAAGSREWSLRTSEGKISG